MQLSKTSYLYSQKLRHENRLWTAVCRAEFDANQLCNVSGIEMFVYLNQ